METRNNNLRSENKPEKVLLWFCVFTLVRAPVIIMLALYSRPSIHSQEAK